MLGVYKPLQLTVWPYNKALPDNLGGGGDTTVIKTLVQLLVRHFHSDPGVTTQLLAVADQRRLSRDLAGEIFCCGS